MPSPGTQQLPGGHLEFGESFFACAERETLEETGLRVRAVKMLAVTNDVFGDLGKHYATIFVKCEMVDANAEPVVSGNSLPPPFLPSSSLFLPWGYRDVHWKGRDA